MNPLETIIIKKWLHNNKISSGQIKEAHTDKTSSMFIMDF